MACLSADNHSILLYSLVLIHGVCLVHRYYAQGRHLWLLGGRGRGRGRGCRAGVTREQYNPTGITVEGVGEVSIKMREVQTDHRRHRCAGTSHRIVCCVTRRSLPRLEGGGLSPPCRCDERQLLLTALQELLSCFVHKLSSFHPLPFFNHMQVNGLLSVPSLFVNVPANWDVTLI